MDLRDYTPDDMRTRVWLQVANGVVLTALSFIVLFCLKDKPVFLLFVYAGFALGAAALSRASRIRHIILCHDGRSDLDFLELDHLMPTVVGLLLYIVATGGLAVLAWIRLSDPHCGTLMGAVCVSGTAFLFSMRTV